MKNPKARETFLRPKLVPIPGQVMYYIDTKPRTYLTGLVRAGVKLDVKVMDLTDVECRQKCLDVARKLMNEGKL